MSVRIEDGGRIVRGTALPFGRPAVVQMKDGQVAEEIFDEQSFSKPPAAPAPLLVNHERRREPVGIVRSLPLRSYGVTFEAELIVSDADLEVWRRRFAAGLVTGVSVAYLSNPRRHRWERPARRGGLPVVRPRDVAGFDEVSLILGPNLPAYDDAVVHSLSQRTARDQRLHEESDRIILEHNMDYITEYGRILRRIGGGSPTP